MSPVTGPAAEPVRSVGLVPVASSPEAGHTGRLGASALAASLQKCVMQTLPDTSGCYRRGLPDFGARNRRDGVDANASADALAPAVARFPVLKAVANASSLTRR